MMRRIIAVAALVAVAAAWGGPTPAASEDGIAVYFSPKGGNDAIVHEIGNAQEEVVVQAYSFTSAPIAKAVRDANNRGVNIGIVLDSSQSTAKYSSATFFVNQGMVVFIDSEHAIAHNKVMVIDRETIITGSFNFSKAAEERNAENLLIITGKPVLAEAYLDSIREHFHHSKQSVGPAQEPDEPATAVGAVYATPRGRKYHIESCRYVRGKATNTTYSSVAEAKAAHLRPCTLCLPPGQ